MRFWGTAAAVTVLAFVQGCELPRPGTRVGTFEVQGELERNECGQRAVPAADPLQFDVELRKDGGRSIWVRRQAPQVSGTIEPDGTYLFESRQQRTVIEPDSQASGAGCILLQRERIDVRVEEANAMSDAAAADAAADSGPAARSSDAGADTMLQGTNTIELEPVSGSNCSAALEAEGGPFKKLPCTLEYSLHGASRPPL